MKDKIKKFNWDKKVLTSYHVGHPLLEDPTTNNSSSTLEEALKILKLKNYEWGQQEYAIFKKEISLV